MKFGLSYFYKPTPAKIRKLADAALAASVFLTGSAIISDYKWLAVSALIIGFIAKFFSNLFAES